MRRIGPMRWIVVIVATLVIGGALAVPAPATAVGSDSGSGSESPGARLATGLDEGLGDKPAMTVARGYDRGYEAQQLLNGAFYGSVKPDGSVVDEDGDAVEPYRDPTNVISDQNAPKVEAGIAKTTKRLDKQYDLAARGKQIDVEKMELFTAMLILGAMVEGYSPEQIIVDGLMSGGLTADPFTDQIVILDEKGKVLKPDGVEESSDTEESAAELDHLADSILDIVAGLDPGLAATEPLRDQVPIEIGIQSTGGEGGSISGSVLGALGTPRDKSLKRFVAGRAVGTLDGSGTCGGQAFKATGSIAFGLSGTVNGDRAIVKLGPTDISLGGNIPSKCLGDLEALEIVLLGQDWGSVDVFIDRGKVGEGTYRGTSSWEDGTIVLTLKAGD